MITGFITDSGLELAQASASGQGWDFAPTDFAVSATAGALDPTRSVANDVLYQGALDRVDLLSGGYYEFVGSVPSGAVEETTQVREIYLLGNDGNEVVFAIGRVDQVVEVGATSGAKFHFVVKLEVGYDAADATLDLTNDPELTDHLADPEAHHVLFSDLRARVADLR